MAEKEILPQKIVDSKTIILKSRLDSNKVRSQGEKLKTSFFVRFGFLKPKRKDIVLVSFNKYYEPYIVIGGKYSIDYCKRHRYALKVEDDTQEIFIDGKKLKSELLIPGKTAKVVKLMGEEHAHYENETYLILNRIMLEVSPRNLLFSPFEFKLENQPKVNYDLRRPNISIEEEIAVLRSKIAKRPSDVAEIIREIFEINERITIFNPIFELTYQNVKNGKHATALINGLNGEVAIKKFEIKTPRKLDQEPIEVIHENLQTTKTQLFQGEPEQTQPLSNAYVSKLTIEDQSENFIVKRETNIPSTAHQLKDNSQFNVENPAHLASNFMKLLGYEKSQFPNNVYLDGENNIVELSLQKGTARVQIETKKRDVEEYEFQETEKQKGFLTAKIKVILFAFSIIAVGVVLRLMNLF